MFYSLCRKKKLSGLSLLPGMEDMHAHLLPGVDDGMKDMNESLEALAFLEGAGVTKIWCTPHIMRERGKNDPGFLRERFNELCGMYRGKIRLELAAEYMMDEGFPWHLKNGLLVFPGNHVLVETSCFAPPAGFGKMIFRLRSEGYEVILAHPERYVYMQEVDYRLLAEQGVKFQLSLLSLWGGYGKEVRKKAEKLLEERMYGFVGSDMHSLQIFRKLLSEEVPPQKQISRLRSLMVSPAFV